MNKSRLLGVTFSLFASITAQAAPVFLGPTGYLSVSDSPFIGPSVSPSLVTTPNPHLAPILPRLPGSHRVVSMTN